MNFGYMLPTALSSWTDFIHPFAYRAYFKNDKLDWKLLERNMKLEEEASIQDMIEYIIEEENVEYKLIGRGSYGRVYDIGCGIAKKVVQSNNFEIIVGSCISHPNILSFNNVKCDPRNFTEIYYNKKEKTLSGIVPNVNHIKQLICAVLALNKAGYYHVDIKPENILYEHKNVFLADLGGCCPIDGAKDVSYGATYLYAAPEVNINKDFKQKSQVWSILLTLIKVLNSNDIELPFIYNSQDFTKKKYDQLLIHIKQLKYTDLKTLYKFDDNTILKYKNFMEYGMVYDYKQRPRLEELLLHPFLNNATGSYCDPIINIINYKFINRKSILNEFKEVSFYKLSIFLHTYHSFDYSKDSILDYIDDLLSGYCNDQTCYGSNVLLPGNSLYYSIRDENHFISFIKEYEKDTSKYLTLTPVERPYRISGIFNLLKYL